MSFHDLYIMLGIGGAFVILGVLGLVWGKVEEGSWYGTVSSRIDVREFVDRTPGRPEPDALKIGGKICIAVGIVLLLIGLGFYLWGMQPPR
jgi:nitrogen fixation-related uncharacterized protein